MMANPDFFRNRFKAVRKDAKESMKTEYESSIVAEMKTNDYLLERGDVKIYLGEWSSYDQKNILPLTPPLYPIPPQQKTLASAGELNVR